MSTSRDNLPAATTHERMDAVEVKTEAVEKKQATYMEQLAALPGRILKPGAYAVLFLLVVGALGGVVGISFAGDKVDERADKRITPAIAASEARQAAALKKHVEEEAAKAEAAKVEIATVKMQSAETMLNMRLVVERLNMKPIILVEQPKDGGL